MKFEELGLGERLLEAIDYMGFTDASPIQELAVPIIKQGRDLIGCAQTGTGKTAAFLLPTLDAIADMDHKKTKVLILAPTRELAIQIEGQVQGFAYFLGISSIAIYGGGTGSEWDTQKKALTTGADIIVATPGKLLSHLNMGNFDFKSISHLILDEADRMLDIGFHDDIIKIISYLPKKRQNLMFSATMAPKIRKFAKEILQDPEEVNIAIAKPAEGVLQAAYVCYDPQKVDLVKQLIADKPNYKSIIVFSSTKKKVGTIVRSLKGNGYEVAGISSDLEQTAREEVLRQFKSRKIRVLVGTDVISRGIDIKDINLVINYDVPGDAADYVHRVGRTARADTTGVAITLVNEPDMYKFRQIEKLIEKDVFKIPMPSNLGDGPEWNPNAKKYSKSGGRPSSGKGRKKGKHNRKGDTRKPRSKKK